MVYHVIANFAADLKMLEYFSADKRAPYTSETANFDAVKAT